jgi:dihydrolipoamide dehydrogenase
MGPEASTLIHEVLVSMRTGNSHLRDITNTIHIHPSLSEVVERGAGSV